MLNEMIKKYRIVELQNHEANITQDHMTICGFFTTEEEFAAHADKLRDNIYRTIPVVSM